MLINRLVRQCICGLLELTIDVTNIPRDVKGTEGITNMNIVDGEQ